MFLKLYALTVTVLMMAGMLGYAWAVHELSESDALLRAKVVDERRAARDDCAREAILEVRACVEEYGVEYVEECIYACLPAREPAPDRVQ